MSSHLSIVAIPGRKLFSNMKDRWPSVFTRDCPNNVVQRKSNIFTLKYIHNRDRTSSRHINPNIAKFYLFVCKIIFNENVQNFKFSNSSVMRFVGMEFHCRSDIYIIIYYQIRNLPSLYPVTNVHNAKFYLKCI